MTIFDRPVFILGAPRSGTSLLHKLIREHPEFVSVARESQLIWENYCHPRLNEWRSEGCPDERITPEMLRTIRRQFADQLLPAGFWRHFDRLGLMRSPETARLLRKLYRPISLSLAEIKKRFPQREGTVRLVDKSVHAGFWINLIEAAFPGARYIHIVRDGEATVDSMLDGWLDPNRFQTYKRPETRQIGGYGDSFWCFPLPCGWRSMLDEPLETVVARQWFLIQKTILDELEVRVQPERCLRIRLENLTAHPALSLRRIAEFIEVPSSPFFTRNAGRLPQVNARSDGRDGIRNPEAIHRVMPMIAAMKERLEYSANDGGA
jgi:hypothetical protein